MKLKKKTEFGVIKVQDENGGPVAAFSNDHAGSIAYECMKSGLVHYPGATLFDEDVGQMMVGDVSDLVGNPI
jgi:hypothetical protein